ncbi:thiolase family protein [Acidithrix ferrooxidans]|uniref:Putative acyltransferase n=1 Tax=Acidithrix ferrooxidans TaxID=1280514 RepID=A0A0D8HLN4_9ACTN|nr:thiolase family protein [Acidithrix ferrooxidans]KJF18667.1 putative acyltransferase [Acidithrix ferrooxidans]
MTRAAVVDVVRTPFAKGRESGSLAGVHPVDLLARCLTAIVERSGIAAEYIDDVIIGCSLPVAEQSGNIARNAVLAAGYPETVPAVSIDRKCGSFQQSMHFAAQGIISGAYDVAVAGGVEVMGLVPMKANRMGKDEKGPSFHRRYPAGLISQGVSAELIASRYNILRQQLDEYSLRSHQLADGAMKTTSKIASMVAIENSGRIVESDDGIRPNSTFEALSSLRPAFYSHEMAERFPEIEEWRITAGNSSQISDGAGAGLIVSEDFARENGLSIKGYLSNFSVVGDDPIMMLTGVIPATRKLLERSGLEIMDIDLFEVNEAFASVVLAYAKELEVPLDRLNVSGGAIAYGHPVGASGVRLFTQIFDDLAQRGGGRGVVTMCESGGMANATLVEVTDG